MIIVITVLIIITYHHRPSLYLQCIRQVRLLIIVHVDGLEIDGRPHNVDTGSGTECDTSALLFHHCRGSQVVNVAVGDAHLLCSDLEVFATRDLLQGMDGVQCG